jgi:hypothetical protein
MRVIVSVSARSREYQVQYNCEELYSLNPAVDVVVLTSALRQSVAGMRNSVRRATTQVALVWSGVVFLCSCAGNGEGLDEEGRPIGSAGTQLTATLASIQDNVFTPICTQCHVGAAAPLGFRLDESSAYAMLVNAPSVEVPSLVRVQPGNPDSSYLIQKLEGTAGVGGQMPLGQPPLPPATIAIIRQWIANGALQQVAAPSVMPMQVRPIVPAEGEALVPDHGEVLLQAAGELNVASVSAATVALMRSGGDGSFMEGNEIVIQPIIEVRSLMPTVLAIRSADGSWVADRYRLTISGHGIAAALDQGGVPIGDFSVDFFVRGAP